MPVSSNFRAISAALCFVVFSGCAPSGQAPSQGDQSYDELINDLGKIEVNISAFEDLPGDTRAEKLLYQAGIISQMQTAMLVVFDTQVRTLRLAGNNAVADELTESRDLMVEAMTLEIGGMVEEAGLIYEENLTPEEIERLIILNSDPAMQKLIRSQPAISQAMLPIGERFGLRAAARFEELAKEKEIDK